MLRGKPSLGKHQHAKHARKTVKCSSNQEQIPKRTSIGKTKLSRRQNKHASEFGRGYAFGKLCLSRERNQNDDKNKNYTTVRVLKNRHTGDTGKCGTLYFDNDTACMVEITEGHERDF